MVERFNGKAPYVRRTHGSERRGVRPVPDLDFGYTQRQSMQDRQKVLALIRERHRQQAEKIHDHGLGNPDLPAFKHKAELVANIDAHKAVIVGGETGSGKSTQLPQYLYEAGYDMTIMLVPRRIIADGLGDRIGEELSNQIEGFKAEEEVGIIHGERTMRHKDNRIIVMTPNTFIKMKGELEQTLGDKKVAIVADEIHEANLFTEIAVGVAAMAVEKNEDWRLIAASATHNAQTLQKPFQKLNKGYVPSIEIEGRPFQIEFIEEPKLTPMEAYARDGAEHQKAMIFTSGKNEIKYIIEQTKLELEKQEKGSSDNVEFRILHGELTEFERAHIDEPTQEGRRLVIVSSPAGMSGITISGVTYVATDGTINRSELDDDNAEGLVRHYLSKAGITQQIGRAGRDVPGGVGVLCKPVVVKKGKARDELAYGSEAVLAQDGMPYKAYEDRDEHEPPEIYITNLSSVVLSVAANDYSFTQINDYIPHPVKIGGIITAEESLTRIGALDDDGKITQVGIGMEKFPVRPELARGLYEAQRSDRRMHMARAALIAAAIDVGGIKDYDASDEALKTQRQIIRHTSKDDLIVELDLMTKLFERTDETWDGYEFVTRHGLHPKRVERVRKTVRKIFNEMGIRAENLIITPPLPSEEQQLRNDFTAGMLDFIYEDIGLRPRTKTVIYRNIHGSNNAQSTKRTISDRSSARVDRHTLVAGIPRYYFKGKTKSGEDIKHDIIGHVFPVDPLVLGRYALENGIVQNVRVEPRMEGDRVVDYEQGMFGSLRVGEQKKSTHFEAISKEAQEVLFTYVLNNPGYIQQALRTLAKDLAGYKERVPGPILATWRAPGARENDLTQDDITEMIRDIARTERTAHGVEEKLRMEMYYSNLTHSHYYDAKAFDEFNRISPLQYDIAGEKVTLHYEECVPYITRLSKKQLASITGPLYLEDGREVLYQREARGGGKERVSFSEIVD